VADNDDFDFDADTDDEPTPKDLRALIKKQQKELKALAEANDKLLSSQRERTVKDFIESKGLSPKVAGLIPASVANDPGSLETWLTEYGDVFGASTAPAATEESVDEADPQTVAAHERVAAATAGSLPETRVQDLQAKIRSAQSPEELQQILASSGL
jgi:hypothetical protein